jgi:uncharacterized protein involved in oxidation of intracellular sulfur
MENILFVVNGPAYGTENAYNALRSSKALVERPDAHVRMFLIGDGVSCAIKEQKPPMGYYIVAKMLSSVIENGAEVAACGTCLAARGITDEMLINGVRRSTMVELAAWIVEASKVVSF